MLRQYTLPSRLHHSNLGDDLERLEGEREDSAASVVSPQVGDHVELIPQLHSADRSHLWLQALMRKSIYDSELR